MNKKFVRAVAVILAVLMVLSVFVGVLSSVGRAAPSKEELERLKKEQSGIQQEMQDLESKINSLEYEQSVTQAKKEVLDEKVFLTQKEIDNINAQIAAYEELIEDKGNEIMRLKAQESHQWSLYKTRIRAMEENGTISYYAIIFGASSFGDMLSRLDTVNAIMEFDKKVYEDLVSAEEATRQAQADLENTKAEEEATRAELREAETLLQEEVAEADALLTELEADKEAYEEYYEEMQEERNRLQKEIAKMEEELRKIQEAANAVKGTGTFAWPAKKAGHVTSRFGWRTHPILGTKKYHSGIDIGGLGYGADILAADGGTVVTSEYSNSYGNYIVISHGNGYSTLYAHMSKRVASKGTVVKKGDLIGYVGSTGLSNGPHLHFEVWKDGSRVNPLNYFSGVKVDDDA